MARVRHPNVVTIHGAQRIDGVTGLSMELIKGRTLAAELADRGPFAADELIRIGIELCRALTAVHEAGLVHRDVKAQNVLRDDRGRIVLGDFGTGRELDDSAPCALAGTPAYVAPELFARQPATPRSDLYSLGTLLFHLATRAYPVPGRSLRELRDSHSYGRRTPLHSARQDFPKRLTRVIEQALDPEPARRFESAESMRRALEACALDTASRRRSRARWLSASAAVVLVVAVSGFTWHARRPEPSPLPFAARDWVLVTAFENRTGEASLDGALDYALERELSNSSFVNVVPRPRIEDTLRLMRKPLDTRVDVAVGQELALRDGQIRAVIAGRVEKIGAFIRLSARILGPVDGLAAASVNEASIAQVDLLRSVGRMAIGIRHKLGETLPRLETSGGQLEKVTTPSMRALQLYSQARALTGEVSLFNTPGTPLAVEQLLRDAVKEDPGFVWAHILLAHALRAQGGRTEVLYHAERAAAAAEPGSVDRYITMGEIDAFRGSFSTSRDERTRYFLQALASFEAALQRQRDHFWALRCLMSISRTIGKFPGPELIEQYIQMRPNNVGVFAQAMDAAIAADDLTLARDYARRGSALDVKVDASKGFSGIRRATSGCSLFGTLYVKGMRSRRCRKRIDWLQTRAHGYQVYVNAMGLKLAAVYLALGRPDRVEQVAAWIEPHQSKRRLLVLASMAREDPGALRVLLKRLFPTPKEALGGHGGVNASVGKAFVDAGMLDSAHSLLATMNGRHAAASRRRGPGGAAFPHSLKVRLRLQRVAPAMVLTCSRNCSRDPATNCFYGCPFHSHLLRYGWREGSGLKPWPSSRARLKTGRIFSGICCQNVCAFASDLPSSIARPAGPLRRQRLNPISDNSSPLPRTIIRLKRRLALVASREMARTESMPSGATIGWSRP